METERKIDLCKNHQVCTYIYNYKAGSYQSLTPTLKPVWRLHSIHKKEETDSPIYRNLFYNRYYGTVTDYNISIGNSEGCSSCSYIFSRSVVSWTKCESSEYMTDKFLLNFPKKAIEETLHWRRYTRYGCCLFQLFR